MFALSFREILAVGIPLLLFAYFAEGQSEGVQCVAALWGGWLGAIFWFVILRSEYVNPFKFIVVFVVLPGFLLAASYFVYRQPLELKPIAHRIERLVENDIPKDSPEYRAVMARKEGIQRNLQKECGWIWLVGSAFAGLVLGPFCWRCIRRYDYSIGDSKRSRALLGKKPMDIDPRRLPPDVSDAYRGRVSIPSDLPMERRIREPAEK